MSQPSHQVVKQSAYRRVARALGAVAVATACAAGAADVAAQAMQAAVGVYRTGNSRFFVDGNFDMAADLKLTFGLPGDVGMLGDLTGSGARHPIVFNSGVWYLDSSRDGAYDRIVYFGGVGDKPLIADMDGDGKDDLIVYRNGLWLVSRTGDGLVTDVYNFGGVAGDVPLLGDVNGDGSPDLLIYRNGVWYGSTARNGVADKVYWFGGGAGDIPIAFDYNGDGTADLGIFRNGQWYVSTNRDGNAQAYFIFGTAGDRPLYFGKGAVTDGTLEAARFLQQVSFGPTPTEIGRVQTMGITAYLDEQLNLPKTNFPVFAFQPQTQPANCTSPLTAGGPADAALFGTNCPRDLYSQFAVQRLFLRNALTAPDQLRQRVAWALSQIWVTSAAQDDIAYANRDYQQLLIDYAFGNFYDVMFRVSVNSFMGNYLDMVNNAKANPTTGQQPNENYAREILQLFAVGLYELKADGTLLLDAGGNPIPTYDQDDIVELSKVFTGWTYWPLAGQSARWNAPINYAFNMMPIESPTNYHDIGTKNILGYVMPGGRSADTDLREALGVIFNNPNVGPFISKQLIQHLVSSNPSPAYVSRITGVFNNNGAGVRGDMKAVVRAIVLDPEARAPRNPVVGTFGKLKEPVTYLTGLVRALGGTSDGVALIGPARAMGQDVYTSPTVFNYYPADFVVPGTSLAGPQFGILDATTYFARANNLYSLIYSTSCDAGLSICGPNPDTSVAGAVGTKFNWAAMKGFATTPETLVDYVAAVVLRAPLPKYQRDAILKAVNSVTVSVTPTQTQLLDRVRMAVYLVAVSPKYQMEF
jgi:hypothetical protein